MINYYNPLLTYGHITGRIRVLETTLITKAQWQRLYAAANLYELQTVLAETVYGDALRDVSSIDEAEKVLNSFLNSYYQLIDDSISHPLVKQQLNIYFRLKYDFVNLKAWLKSALGQEIKWPLSKLGLVAPEHWETAVAEEKVLKAGAKKELVQALFSSIDKAYGKFKQYNRLEVIDAVLDVTYFATLLHTAKQLKNEWLLNLTKYLIDLANLKIVLRSLTGLKLTLPLSDLLIGGGFLPVAQLMSVSSQEQLKEILAWPNEQLTELGRTFFTKDQTFNFDYLIDAYLRKYLTAAKYVVAGVEVVVAYLLLREIEVKQVRTLLFAHLASLKPDFITQWVTVVG